MAIQSWTVIDTENDLFDEDFAMHGALSAGMPDGWSVAHRVFRGGLSDGVSVIELNNGRLTLAILPTRGMSVWKAWMEGKELGWRSPVRGPVHPKFVPVFDPSGLGWLEGFDELVVRCGLESNGAPDFGEDGRLLYPLHGRVGNLPARKVEVAVDDQAGTLSVRGVVEEARFHFQKLRLTASISTSFNSSSFALEDEVENLGGMPATMQMIYHINVGHPLLDAGSQFIAPISRLAPRNDHAAADVGTWPSYKAPTAGYQEQVYFAELAGDDRGHTQVLLKNAMGNSGLGVRYHLQALPYFVLWKNTVALDDGYVTGLEPATNLPNPRSFEISQARVVELESHQQWKSSVHVDWLTTRQEVAAAEAKIALLKSGTEAAVHSRPLPEWSV